MITEKHRGLIRKRNIAARLRRRFVVEYRRVASKEGVSFELEREFVINCSKCSLDIKLLNCDIAYTSKRIVCQVSFSISESFNKLKA